MAIDPNVLSYFLIILGGFGVVWSYRSVSGRGAKPTSEFAYAAFSTLWGIPLFMLFSWLLRNRSDLMGAIFKVPMVATPSLFILGSAIGALAALVLGSLKMATR